MVDGAKDYLLRWNYQFPLDRWWRKKYGVSLFSEQHLNASQADIVLEWLEEKLFEEIQQKAELQEKIDTDYRNGKWIRNSSADSITEKEESDLFDKISVREVNSKIQVE